MPPDGSVAPATDPGTTRAVARRRGLRTLAAALVVATSGVLPAFLVGAVGVRLQADLALTNAGLGLVVSTLFVTAGVTAIPLGRMVDRLGWPRGVRIAAIGSAATLAGIGLLARRVEVLLALLVVGGLAHAVAAPAANLALIRELPGARQGLIFGLKQSSTSAALLLGGLAVPTVVAAFGWRAAFLIAAAVPVVAALVVPSSQTAKASGRWRRDRAAPAPERPAGLIAVTLAGAAAAATVTATAGFVVVSAVASGMAEAAAGVLLAAGSAASLVSRVAVGWHADRRGSRSLWSVAVLLGVGAAGLAGIATGRPALVVVGAVVAFAAGAGWPGLYHLAVVHRHPGTPAAATGTVQTGLSIGAALGPLGFGLVADRWSFALAWSIAATAAVCAAVLVLLAARSWRATTLPVRR